MGFLNVHGIVYYVTKKAWCTKHASKYQCGALHRSCLTTTVILGVSPTKYESVATTILSLPFQYRTFEVHCYLQGQIHTLILVSQLYASVHNSTMTIGCVCQICHNVILKGQLTVSYTWRQGNNIAVITNYDLQTHPWVQKNHPLGVDMFQWQTAIAVLSFHCQIHEHTAKDTFKKTYPIPT